MWIKYSDFQIIQQIDSFKTNIWIDIFSFKKIIKNGNVILCSSRYIMYKTSLIELTSEQKISVDDLVSRMFMISDIY